MKKLLAVLSIFAFGFGLASCGSKTTKQENVNDQATAIALSSAVIPTPKTSTQTAILTTCSTSSDTHNEK